MELITPGHKSLSRASPMSWTAESCLKRFTLSFEHEVRTCRYIYIYTVDSEKVFRHEGFGSFSRHAFCRRDLAGPLNILKCRLWANLSTPLGTQICRQWRTGKSPRLGPARSPQPSTFASRFFALLHTQWVTAARERPRWPTATSNLRSPK